MAVHKLEIKGGVTMTLPHAGVKNPTKAQLQAQVKALQKNIEVNGNYTRGLLAEITQLKETITGLHAGKESLNKLFIEDTNKALEGVDMWKQIATERAEELKQSQDSNYNLCIERNNLQNELKSLRKDWAELSAHHKAQMMSVYYLLDTCMHYGSHTEKRVSMQHLKLTIEKLIANGDDLRNTLVTGLPF